MSDPSTVEVALRDPLSEVTRKERRALLGVSVLSLLVAKSGLVPEKVSALGIELTRVDQKAFLGIVILVVSYFVVAFVIYGLTDFLAWRVSYNEGAKAAYQAIYDRFDRKVRGVEEESSLRPPRAWVSILPKRLAIPVSLVRTGFGFVLPVAVGGYVIYALVLFRDRI